MCERVVYRRAARAATSVLALTVEQGSADFASGSFPVVLAVDEGVLARRSSVPKVHLFGQTATRFKSDERFVDAHEQAGTHEFDRIAAMLVAQGAGCLDWWGDEPNPLDGAWPGKPLSWGWLRDRRSFE